MYKTLVQKRAKQSWSSGAFVTTNIPLPTGRTAPSEGEFLTSPLTYITEEPPPSRLTAFHAPIPLKISPNSKRVTPREEVCRPSTSTK